MKHIELNSHYKYISWDANEQIIDVLKDIAKESKGGDWRLVSHSHSQFGMSVIMECMFPVNPQPK